MGKQIVKIKLVLFILVFSLLPFISAHILFDSHKNGHLNHQDLGNINSGRAGVTDVLDVVFAVFYPLSGRQDGVQDVFLFGLALHWGQGSLPLGSYRRRLSYSFKFELQPKLVAQQ